MYNETLTDLVSRVVDRQNWNSGNVFSSQPITSPIDVRVAAPKTVPVVHVGLEYYELLAREQGLFPSRKRK